MTSESDIEQRHRDKARRLGWFVEKIMRAGRIGFPDRFYARGTEEDVCVCCGRGRVVLMEWKKPKGRVDPIQEKRIAELKAAGVEVHIVRSVDEANAILAG